jgi:ABC-type microcin C transport system duplicated ATPase subunit YejF
MAEPLLRVDGLSVAFESGGRRTEAVRNLSYTLARGETLAIVGESGSGKSVSSLALLGLLAKPGGSVEAGQAWFDGRDLLAMAEPALMRIRGDRITMIFQEPMTSLNPVLTIGRQLTEGLIEHKSMSPRAAEARAVGMLDLVGLSEPASRLKQYPHQLSGGMRQRVMIAMAMASDPAILIADEPTTALDVTVQAQILDLMRALKADFDASIILITHDMGVVAEMADRVVVMYQGEKVEEGAVATIFDHPRQNPRMSAGRLVAEPMVIHELASGSELEDRVAELFRRVGLERDHARRYPHEFSGGQRQRLCIARALGVGPKLIVADEPTSALDVSVQAQVIDLMLELQDAFGLSYLFISHDMAVVERMSHRVAVMHRGRIVELGPRRDVLGDPRHPYTRALLAAVPVPDPTHPRGKLPPIDVEEIPRGPLTEVAPNHLVAAA